MYCSSLSVSMANNISSGVKKDHKSTEPGSPQTAKMFLSSSRRASSKLRDFFKDGFCMKRQHFTPSSAPAHRFYSLSRHFWTGHWRTVFICNAILHILHHNISNSVILSNNDVSLLIALCAFVQVKKMVSQVWSHSSSVTGLNYFVQSCEKAMGWYLLSVKCWCFVQNPSWKSHAILK